MEIEAKFFISPPAARGAQRQSMLRARLRRMGWRVALPRRVEINWIFDDGCGSLRARGALLRLRHSGTRWLLTAKGPARFRGGLKARPEAETTVADGPACRRALALLGYRPRLRYSRYRTTYRQAGRRGELDWDETPMGVYVELEGPAAWVRARARELGLDPAAAETRTYPELYAAYRARAHTRPRRTT